jgi:hypothetical protein
MKDKDAFPKPVLAVHKYIKPQPPRHEPDEEEAFEAYQEARAQSREAIMLDIRLADGRIFSFPYLSLRKAKYDPAGFIVLRFDGDEVTAEGRNLHRLRDAIAEHRARFIQEGTDIERGLKPEDAVHIERIIIAEAGAED